MHSGILQLFLKYDLKKHLAMSIPLDADCHFIILLYFIPSSCLNSLQNVLITNFKTIFHDTCVSFIRTNVAFFSVNREGPRD